MFAPEPGETLQQAEPLEGVDMDSQVACKTPDFLTASVRIVRNAFDFFLIGRGKRREEIVHEVNRFIA
jgi:hypothetical protein